MRPGRALLAAAAALAALFVATSAFAQRVVLVRPPAPDDVLSEAFNRLRAELSLQGFETSVVDLAPGDNAPEALSELARKAGAFAGISLTRRVGTPAAEVCIADRVTGKTSLRTLALSREPDAPSVLAVRAADLLRSSLREFPPDQKPPPEVVGVDKPMPEAVERWVSTPASRLRLDVRAALLGITERVGPGYAPSLALTYRALDRIAVGLSFAGPALGASFKSSLGSATVRQELLLARILGAAYRSDTFELRPTISAGIYHLDARGEVNPPLEGRSSQLTTFAGGIGLEADVRLGHSLVLGGELCALELSPRPAVAVLNDQYSWSTPFVTASAGIGVEF